MFCYLFEFLLFSSGFFSWLMYFGEKIAWGDDLLVIVFGCYLFIVFGLYCFWLILFLVNIVFG